MHLWLAMSKMVLSPAVTCLWAFVVTLDHITNLPLWQNSLIFPTTTSAFAHLWSPWPWDWSSLLAAFWFISIHCSEMNQFSSVTQACPTLCHTMNSSMPGLPVHHQLPEFTQTHAHRVGDAIQPSHPLSSPSPPAPNPSQHQSLFQWVNSSHEVATVLEFQL